MTALIVQVMCCFLLLSAGTVPAKPSPTVGDRWLTESLFQYFECKGFDPLQGKTLVWRKDGELGIDDLLKNLRPKIECRLFKVQVYKDTTVIDVFLTNPHAKPLRIFQRDLEIELRYVAWTNDRGQQSRLVNESNTFLCISYANPNKENTLLVSPGRTAHASMFCFPGVVMNPHLPMKTQTLRYTLDSYCTFYDCECEKNYSLNLHGQGKVKVERVDKDYFQPSTVEIVHEQLDAIHRFILIQRCLCR